MFRGASTLNLDAKGRLAMPSKFRERLSVEESGEMVLTVDQKNCLLLYPLSEWLVVEEKLQALPSFDPDSQAIRRLYMNYATEVKVDGGGRILIPQNLRDHACLEKKVVLSGQGRKFELWSEDSWNEDFVGVQQGVKNIDWNNVSDALKSLSI